MNDDDLIRDMERATRRLDDSLKVCRKIINSYRSSLTLAAGNSGDNGSALFEWPDSESEPDPESNEKSAPPTPSGDS